MAGYKTLFKRVKNTFKQKEMVSPHKFLKRIKQSFNEDKQRPAVNTLDLMNRQTRCFFTKLFTYKFASKGNLYKDVKTRSKHNQKNKLTSDDWTDILRNLLKKAYTPNDDDPKSKKHLRLRFLFCVLLFFTGMRQ